MRFDKYATKLSEQTVLHLFVPNLFTEDQEKNNFGQNVEIHATMEKIINFPFKILTATSEKSLQARTATGSSQIKQNKKIFCKHKDNLIISSHKANTCSMEY